MQRFVADFVFRFEAGLISGLNQISIGVLIFCILDGQFSACEKGVKRPAAGQDFLFMSTTSRMKIWGI